MINAWKLRNWVILQPKMQSFGLHPNMAVELLYYNRLGSGKWAYLGQKKTKIKKSFLFPSGTRMGC
jgi:hypothetical protein